jgi:hypothetical protein
VDDELASVVSALDVDDEVEVLSLVESPVVSPTGPAVVSSVQASASDESSARIGRTTVAVGTARDHTAYTHRGASS